MSPIITIYHMFVSSYDDDKCVSYLSNGFMYVYYYMAVIYMFDLSYGFGKHQLVHYIYHMKSFTQKFSYKCVYVFYYIKVCLQSILSKLILLDCQSVPYVYISQVVCYTCCHICMKYSFVERFLSLSFTI